MAWSWPDLGPGRDNRPVRPRRAISRALAKLALLAAMITALVPALAGVAQAHATLIATSPQAGFAVPSSPRVISLTFDAPVTIGSRALGVSTHGITVPVAPPQLEAGGIKLVATVRRPLAAGTYTVSWQVTGDDGDVVAGTYSFGVGSSASGGAAASTTTRGLVSVALLRWLLFAGLALGLGGAFGARLAQRPAADRALLSPPPLYRTAATMTLVAAIGLASHLLGAGSLLNGLGHFSLVSLAGSAAGRLALVELLGAGLALALSVAVPGRAAGAIPMLAIVGAEGVRAHPEAAAPAVGALMTVVHLVAAALWVGALIHLLRVAARWRSDPEAARQLLRGYLRPALGLYAVVIVTGVATAFLLLPNLADLVTTGYGQVLLVKSIAVALVTTLAVLSRRRLGHPLLPGWISGGRALGAVQPSPGAVTGPAVRAERAVLIAILGITALLVSLAPPLAASPLSAPPAPTGPVLPGAFLAGQVTVDTSLSNNELLVTLHAPDAGEPPPRFSLTGRIRAAGAPTTPVPFRGCGQGCFVASVRPHRGHSQLRLTAKATGWQGGTVSQDLSWPPQLSRSLLPAVVAHMRSIRRLTVHELDSSNTDGPSYPSNGAFSGPQFLAAEPYANIAPSVVVLARTPSLTEIAFAFSAQHYYLRLWFDRLYRIDRETLVTPDHLIRRTFSYP